MNTTIEELIDRTSLDRVLKALADVCAEKSDHVLCNWQDAPMSERWRHAAEVMDNARTRIDV
jgi:hypothetical protein